jgi:hypothetical protein
MDAEGRLERECEELRALLRDYELVHKGTCRCRWDSNAECDCGLTERLRALSIV